MTTTRFGLLALVISHLFLGIVLAERGVAIEPADGDWPLTLEGSLEETVKGNPLADGDSVYSIRGGYRFFSGQLGIEGALGYAEPTSGFVQSLGQDATLLLLDFSFVWYANYPQQEKIWRRGSPIKPELILFGGPGLASLRIDDPLPGPVLGGASGSQVFFTLNAGIGVKLYRIQDNAARSTSRWYLRPEIRARWFDSPEGDVDWTVGLALGYGLGDRPSCRSLALRVEETVDDARSLETSRTAAGHSQYEEIRSALADLKAQVTSYGGKCKYLRERLSSTIDDLNRALTGLRTRVDVD